MNITEFAGISSLHVCKSYHVMKRKWYGNFDKFGGGLFVTGLVILNRSHAYTIYMYVGILAIMFGFILAVIYMFMKQGERDE